MTVRITSEYPLIDIPPFLPVSKEIFMSVRVHLWLCYYFTCRIVKHQNNNKSTLDQIEKMTIL